ncbi:hypothetical protein RJ639_042563 [Escallonia herrerae]|uniref:Small ribosomal subunit protein mS38 n=1 Tax=Escallonia herrerae TaxID=1293975 RepID=A0AA89BAP7_9ASTE|nr:hypothetical protein RJ639_042563 [Escallonia herrerae]
MAGALHKLLTRTSHQRIITSFAHENPFKFITSPPIFHQPHTLNSSPKPTSDSSPTMEKGTAFDKFPIYPSFSFGNFLDPVSLSGLCKSTSVAGDEAAKSDGMVWADSVKKKRKKKMNKHKLNKLRKRLRHHS